MRLKASASLFFLLAVPVPHDTDASSSPLGYIIGGIIAFLIFGYLIYTLLRPEKF